MGTTQAPMSSYRLSLARPAAHQVCPRCWLPMAPVVTRRSVAVLVAVTQSPLSWGRAVRVPRDSVGILA